MQNVTDELREFDSALTGDGLATSTVKLTTMLGRLKHLINNIQNSCFAYRTHQ